MTFLDTRDRELPQAPKDHERLVAGEVSAAVGALLYPSPREPMAVARQLLREVFTDPADVPTLVHWRGDWWFYGESGWALLEEIDLRGVLYRLLEHSSYIDGEDIFPWGPTRARLSNVLEPLMALAREFISDEAEVPLWLGQRSEPPAGEFVPLSNGLLHLPTRQLRAHTPALFTSYRLDYPYVPEAESSAWSQFLAGVFAHDRRGEELLQEFAGVVVSGRMDLHKALLVIGPPRAGKGTISRILKQLVGMTNTYSPSLSDFASQFGLSGLIGKPLAIVEDARGDDDRRSNRLAERLLGITGEDQLTIDRKNREPWRGTLPTRLVLISNEMPRFLDASGAVVNRFMAVKLQRSFLGNEDRTLEPRLSKELSGILNWALAGLDRLDQQGRFTVPGTMGDMLQEMSDTAAPITAFLEESYEVTGAEGDQLPLSEVHRTYRAWCEAMGSKCPSQPEFQRRLNASTLGVQVRYQDLAGVGPKQGRRRRQRVVFGLKPQ